MGKLHECITEDLQDFIRKQHLFFVATAPLDANGHVNLSPKGYDCLRILSPYRVMYLDLTGSGNETSAHVQENGRITLMFCAFEGAPMVLRLYGQGRVVLPGDAEWDDLSRQFPTYLSTRQIMLVDVQRVWTACGYAVPLMDFVSERDTLLRWADAKGADGIAAYRREKNLCSIDDLPTPLARSVES